MMCTTSVTITLDEQLRQAVTAQLQAVGLTLNAYFVLAAKQLVIQDRIPFAVLTPGENEPNAVTRRAMVVIEAKELGLIPDDSPVFTDVAAMMAYLDQNGEF
ncbi:type II toxin-antitoxin system RelB/DinJ family antitoxin [Levilactobacillus parabrevis]|uniref:type II toxin-antitoxin system RelB/DinJ family antitoxin n=1 Tax=Levilactobacillus parabrevis TaxID=357278 RepID=UPI0003A89748|nr:type II toxin-antitoxin system RelB/DinJ family antitoxin [Levilactobacillus parabrevis]